MAAGREETRAEGGAIELRGVRHHFGAVRALDGVTLAVPRGCLFGLVGLNGAGKTTLLHVVLGLLAPEGGSATVLGVSAARISCLAGRVGAVTHRLGLEPSLTAAENLRLHALRHGRRGIDPAGVLHRLDLDSLAARRVSRLSQGERQRVALARALLLGPDVLVLDEPFANLDPAAARRAVGILREEVRDRGAAVLVSSHQLRHVERACDRLAVLHEGRVVREGTLDTVLAAAPARLLVRAAPLDGALRVLRGHPIVRAVEVGAGIDGGKGDFGRILMVTLRDPRPEIVAEALHRGGIRVRQLGMEPLVLDDLFSRGRLAGGDGMPPESKGAAS